MVSQNICDLIIPESDRAGVRVGISQHISKLPESKGVQARLQAPGKDKLGREFMIEFSLETVNSASQEAWLVYYSVTYPSKLMSKIRSFVPAMPLRLVNAPSQSLSL